MGVLEMSLSDVEYYIGTVSERQIRNDYLTKQSHGQSYFWTEQTAGFQKNIIFKSSSVLWAYLI